MGPIHMRLYETVQHFAELTLSQVPGPLQAMIPAAFGFARMVPGAPRSLDDAAAKLATKLASMSEEEVRASVTGLATICHAILHGPPTDEAGNASDGNSDGGA